MVLSGPASAHHDSGELELYPDDAGDACILGTQQIRVTIHGVYHEGIMKLELYNDDEGFLKKSGRLRPIRVPAEDYPQTICINVDEPGEYAVSGYHDKDGDRKLDKKWNFTPKEPYGVSNNPKMKGKDLPDFVDAAFNVPPNGVDIDIILVDLRKKKPLVDSIE